MTQTVAIYARYSSDNQRDASIEDQVRICRARAEREGWTVIKVFADRALSGATTERPGYLDLFEFVRGRRVDIVLTESLDRLSRDQEHLAAFYKLTSFTGTRIVTLSEDHVSEMHIGIKGMMGALYLKDLAQKTKRGLEGRIRAGRSIGGPPYGYAVVRRLGENGEPERGLREIDLAEAAVVRRIFRDYVAGMSPLRIAKTLNAEGISGPSGGIWYDSTIRGHWNRGDGILRNAAYTGKIVWNRQQSLKDPVTGRRHRRSNRKDEFIVHDAPALRIVDDVTWQAAQDRLTQDQAAKVEKAKHGRRSFSYAFWDQRRPRHLISGKVICGCCGKPFLTSGKDYMRCYAAANGACGNRTSVRWPIVEAHALEVLGKRLMAPVDVADFAAAFDDEWKKFAGEVVASNDAQRREVASIRRKIAHIVDAIADGGRNPALQAKLNTLTAEHDRLLAETAGDQPELPPLTADLAEVYHAQMSRLQQAVASDSASESRERIRELIDQIIVHPPGEDGRPRLEFVGDLTSMLALAGLSSRKEKHAQGKRAIDMLVSSVKEAQGALPPGPPPRPEALEPSPGR